MVIAELSELYQDAPIYLRGDFNVSQKHQNRTAPNPHPLPGEHALGGGLPHPGHRLQDYHGL